MRQRIDFTQISDEAMRRVAAAGGFSYNARPCAIHVHSPLRVQWILAHVGRIIVINQDGQVAQLVEQRTENPCVGGSIPPLATTQSRPYALLIIMSRVWG